jgi:glycosyltransferase involved in cell wall biosynthesis
MKTGTVTVVIPVYKAERWIAETLVSAMRQTYTDLEILVVDDGSPDNSSRIVEEFCRQDSRIRLIHKENGGLSSARNRGLEEAEGEFFAPLDADDLWHPDKLRLQVEAFQNAGPEAGLVYCWCSAIDENGSILRRDAGMSHAEGDVLLDLIMAGWMPSGSIPLFRTSAIRSAGGYLTSLTRSEDIDLYLRIAEHATFLAVRQFLVGYRQHSSNMSSDAVGMVQQYERVMRDLRRRLPRIPAELIRWSIANHRFHYGLMALRAREFSIAVWLLTTALYRDPWLLERVPGILRKKMKDHVRHPGTGDGGDLKGRRFVDLLPAEGVPTAQHPDRWARRKAGLTRKAGRGSLRLPGDRRNERAVTVGTLR